MTLADLRYSYAAAAIQSGGDVEIIQGSLGHAAVSFALDIYGRVTAKMKHDSVERMQAHIDSIQTG